MDSTMDATREPHRDCAYCMVGINEALIAEFGIPLLELEHSHLVLFKEQSHRGRCIVAAKQHVDDISDLSESDSAAFMGDVRLVARALHTAFSPDKINFGAYGDLMHHLHVHLVPKYRGDAFEWGDVFSMDPKRVLLDTDEYREIGAAITDALHRGAGSSDGR